MANPINGYAFAHNKIYQVTMMLFLICHMLLHRQVRQFYSYIKFIRFYWMVQSINHSPYFESKVRQHFIQANQLGTSQKIDLLFMHPNSFVFVPFPLNWIMSVDCKLKTIYLLFFSLSNVQNMMIPFFESIAIAERILNKCVSKSNNSSFSFKWEFSPSVVNHLLLLQI